MSLAWLDDSASPRFPPTEQALDDPPGLLAVGGRLTADWLIAAYQQGIFPWYSDQEPILWWSPSPRCVFPPGAVHVSRRLRRRLRHMSGLRIRIGPDFDRVIDQCAGIAREGQPGTWITAEMMAAYRHLYRLGYATALSVWNGDDLVGGLYGVSLGTVLFGESMFSAQQDGSKIALIAVDYLMRRGAWQLLDAQVASPHLLRMGAEMWSREQFEAVLPGTSGQHEPRLKWPEELDVNAFLQDVAP